VPVLPADPPQPTELTRHATSSAPAPARPLALSTKLFYGAPAFAGAAMAIPIAIHMPKFYSDVILAPLGLVALAIAVARSLDALTDPLMGWITDRTRSRWGRRKPWIALGVPLTAVAVIALFTPPESLGPRAAAGWFTASFALYFLFHTVYQIPHGALGAEVSLDYHERSSLFAWQAFFIALGTIAAAAAPAIVIGWLGPGSDRAAFTLIAVVIATLLVALYGLLVWKVPERREFADREANPLVPGVRRALRNRPFRIIFLSGLTNAIPAAMPAILLPFMVEYVIQPANPELWLTILLVVYMATGLVFIPIWMLLSKHIGKLGTLVTASTVGITGSLMLFFIGTGDLAFAVFVFFVTGTQSQVGNVLVPAMAADTIDYDELLTGKRREAQFGSFWAIVPKFVAIPGSSIPLAILGWVGYVPNVPQTEEVTFTIRFLVGLFPALFYVIALLILARYPISESAHAAIRDGIEAHGKGRDAVDPLTGQTLSPPSARAETEEVGWFLDHFSTGELRRAIRLGLARPLRDVALCAVIALGISAAAAVTVVERVTDLTSKPGPWTVIAVVVSGFAFTMFCFHMLRLRPARRLARGGCDRSALERHLADLEAGAVKTP
jgi:GPH family glycoside/pentoside/hexuronide:cation symporter